MALTAAWIHDHAFYYDSVSGEVYSKSGVNYGYLARFTKYFEKLYVVGRQRQYNRENDSAMSICTGPGLHFKLVTECTRATKYITKYRVIGKQLKNVIDKVDCVIIVLPSIFGYLSINYCRKICKPYMTHVIGCSYDTLNASRSIVVKLSAPFFFYIQRNYIVHSPAVAYITEKFLQNRYPSNGIKGNCIANVIISEPNASVLLNRQKRIQAITYGTTITIGLIGSLDVDFKGHDVAIRSIKIVKDKFPNIVLRLLGPGNFKRWKQFACKEGVEDSIVYDGVLPSGPQVYGWLDEVDIYIQPSRSEAHGRSVVEAMSRGCVVFASAIGGLSDSLPKENLHKSSDYKLLASKIIEVISSKEKLMNIAAANIERTSKYSPERLQLMRDDFFHKWIDSIAK